MKKLHWTDSEFDRTYVLFCIQCRPEYCIIIIITIIILTVVAGTETPHPRVDHRLLRQRWRLRQLLYLFRRLVCLWLLVAATAGSVQTSKRPSSTQDLRTLGRCCRRPNGTWRHFRVEIACHGIRCQRLAHIRDYTVRTHSVRPHAR